MSRSGGDPNRRKDLRQIIGDDTVADPLRIETEADQDVQSLSVALGSEETHIRDSSCGGGLGLNGSLHLVELVYDQFVALVTVGMVFGQDINSFVVFPFRHKPSGAFRTEYEEQSDLCGGRNGLEHDRQFVRPVG